MKVFFLELKKKEKEKGPKNNPGETGREYKILSDHLRLQLNRKHVILY